MYRDRILYTLIKPRLKIARFLNFLTNFWGEFDLFIEKFVYAKCFAYSIMIEFGKAFEDNID